MNPLSIFLSFLALFGSLAPANSKPLFQRPALSTTQIAFVYAGDLWLVSREGGTAQRLTAGAGIETRPFFSPDGREIAFTGEYDGNVDVYVVATAGGIPKRITWHPAPDQTMGWTPDGKSILFSSRRTSNSVYSQLFTIPREGGFPTPLPLPMGAEASYSPDGSRLAYVPLDHAFSMWKRYRGGRTSPIWIAQLSDSSIEKLPRNNSNDFNPVWVDDRVFFLSDRNGPVTLFSYDTKSKAVAQAIANTGLDLKSASAGPGGIVYEQFGAINLFELKSGKSRPVDIRVTADLPEVRPRFVKAAAQIRTAQLSPTGARAVFEARGEILTVPAEKGDIRNLTNTPGVNERFPSWSPDGSRIAYFSDESGEYALHIRKQDGMGDVQKIDLGSPPSFFYFPEWSPDSKKIAFTDKRLNLWYVDLANGKPVQIFKDTFTGPQQIVRAAWSPDSKWLVYTKQGRSHMRSVYVYSIETGKMQQITDGMSDEMSPVFDRGGKYIYLVSSTDVGPQMDTSMMSLNKSVTSNIYVVVLRRDLPSPLRPESDEEEAAKVAAAENPEASKSKEPPAVRIDFEKISQRVLALPIPARNYQGIIPGKEGVLFLIEGNAIASQGGPLTIYKFDLKTRKVDKLVEGVSFIWVSHNGEKMLYRQGGGPAAPGQWIISRDRWASRGRSASPGRLRDPVRLLVPGSPRYFESTPWRFE